jgi:hypothetical protein
MNGPFAGSEGGSCHSPGLRSCLRRLRVALVHERRYRAFREPRFLDQDGSHWRGQRQRRGYDEVRFAAAPAPAATSQYERVCRDEIDERSHLRAQVPGRREQRVNRCRCTAPTGQDFDETAVADVGRSLKTRQ